MYLITIRLKINKKNKEYTKNLTFMNFIIYLLKIFKN